MPLYMDRHDLPGATPEQVAQAHGQDLEAAAKHDVQLLPYWLDTDREMAFCFARAAEPGDLAALRVEVNLASRICDAADAGHIPASDVVHDLGMRRSSCSCSRNTT